MIEYDPAHVPLNIESKGKRIAAISILDAGKRRPKSPRTSGILFLMKMLISVAAPCHPQEKS